MSNTTHWTERSAEDFLYSIASDFVEQLQSKMKALDNMTRAKLSKAAGISKGRISQIFNDPGNISLDTIVRLARAVGLKVSVIAYDDVDDPNNERGPANAEIFNILWERAGRPFDMWDIRELPKVATTADAMPLAPLAYWEPPSSSRHAGNPYRIPSTLTWKQELTDGKIQPVRDLKEVERG
jgi:transcriptional regulator with XRE-family HTH domain